MHEKTDKRNIKISPDVAWIREETAYLLATIRSISSSIRSYTVDNEEKYYFEVNNISCVYSDKKQAYNEYSDLVNKLNAFHYHSIE